MTSYFYWICTFAGVFSILGVVGIKWKHWQAAGILAALVLVCSSGYYYFYLQNILVKRWGGAMSLSVPSGQHHLQVTWKDDNLWVENYDPKSNSCIFSEYSRGNLLQGRVVIKDCNPLMPGATIQPAQ